jgi:hypothetical protein
MIFDDEYNITGVIDWSYTTTARIESFAQMSPADFQHDEMLIPFLQRLQRREAEIDPTTPLSEFIEQKSCEANSINRMEGNPRTKALRHMHSQVLFGQLYAKDAK